MYKNTRKMAMYTAKCKPRDASQAEAYAEALTEAAVAVAHIASEIEEAAERQEDGLWTITADDMHQLRAAIGTWRRAGDALLQSIGRNHRG